MRTLTTIAALALVLGWAGIAAAQGGEEKTPPPPGEGNGESLASRKKAFMQRFSQKLSKIGKEETSPERREIARLEDLKKDYEGKLQKSQNNLGRAKKVVIDSFTQLIQRNQDKEDVETRCESIWLDYLRQSRDAKAAIFEYQGAIRGLKRRINFIRAREVERELPGLDQPKYYTADNLEVYGEEEGMDFNVFGAEESHVSYYAMLKDFVLEMSGGGRGRDDVVEKFVEEPPLVRKWKDWLRRTQLREK
ncbi:MAG: hypothetical protein ACYTHM_00155 [Planctomycetota bacterium]